MKKEYTFKFQFDPERTGWTSVGVLASVFNNIVAPQNLQVEIIEDAENDRKVTFDFVEKFEAPPKQQSLQKAFENVAKVK